jgi:hypothetical protein
VTRSLEMVHWTKGLGTQTSEVFDNLVSVRVQFPSLDAEVMHSPHGSD